MLGEEGVASKDKIWRKLLGVEKVVVEDIDFVADRDAPWWSRSARRAGVGGVVRIAGVVARDTIAARAGGIGEASMWARYENC